MVQKSFSVLLVGNGSTEIRGLRKTFEKMGHRVRSLNVNQYKEFTPIKKIIEEERPDFCLSRNLEGLEPGFVVQLALLAYLSDNQIPTAVWYWNHPYFAGDQLTAQFWLRTNLPKSFHYFCADRSQFLLLQERGLKSELLPPSIDEELQSFEPNPKMLKAFENNVSYFGQAKTPKNPQAELTSEYQKYAERVIKEFADGKSESPETQSGVYKAVEASIGYVFQNLQLGRAELAGRLEEVFSRCRQAFPAENFLALLGLEGRLIQSYSQFRLSECLQALSKKGGKVFGDLNETEKLTLYRASKINFNFTQFDFHDLLPENLLEIIAAGGFVLSDRQKQISESFSEDEVGFYDSTSALPSLVDKYLKNDSARTAAVERAREKVFKAHTHRQRIEKIVECLQLC